MKTVKSQMKFTVATLDLIIVKLIDFSVHLILKYNQWKMPITQLCILQKNSKEKSGKIVILQWILSSDFPACDAISGGSDISQIKDSPKVKKKYRLQNSAVSGQLSCLLEISE